jgi:glycosyltransferase involved in cell wall biosynthesis
MQAKIKILFTYANTSELGGADFCLHKLATALDPKRFDVHVALSRSCDLDVRYAQAGIQVHHIPMPRLQVTKNPLRLVYYALFGFRAVILLVRLLRELDIDIVHGNDLLDFYGPIAARLKGAKAIQHVRMILRPGMIKEAIIRLALFINDRVVAISDGVAKAMFEKEGIVPQKVVMIYDWNDMKTVGHSDRIGTFRQELGIGEDVLLIGTVGRLQAWKGQHVFIEAAKLVADKVGNVFFTICGSPVAGRGREAYALQLRALANNLGLANKMRFTGYRTDIANLMTAFDIFVHSAVEPEPFGLVVMEASECGTPVVAARAGGVPEIVLEGESGFLHNPGDSVALANCIHEMIRMGSDGRKKMGQKGKEYVMEKFAREGLAARFEALYASLLV